MTNEEKALDITFGWADDVQECAKDAAMKMAEWKDNQFKEYLEKKNTGISNIKAKLDRNDAYYMLCTLKSLFIDEIISELFEETEQDNSDRDE